MPIAAAQRATKPSASHGADVFQQSGCTHCHSLHGTGGRSGPALDDIGRRWKRSAIERQILLGSDEMPPFGEALSPADTGDLVAFLHKAKAKPLVARR